jgi:hypothetical protein
MSHYGPMYETQDISYWEAGRLADWLAGNPDWRDAEIRSCTCEMCGDVTELVRKRTGRTTERAPDGRFLPGSAQGSRVTTMEMAEVLQAMIEDQGIVGGKLTYLVDRGIQPGRDSAAFVITVAGSTPQRFSIVVEAA